MVFMGFSLKPTSRRHFAKDTLQGVNTQIPTGKSFWMRLARDFMGGIATWLNITPFVLKGAEIPDPILSFLLVRLMDGSLHQRLHNGSSQVPTVAQALSVSLRHYCPNPMPSTLAHNKQQNGSITKKKHIMAQRVKVLKGSGGSASRLDRCLQASQPQLKDI